MTPAVHGSPHHRSWRLNAILRGGPTESLCRTLTTRLKGGGKRWNTPNAEALMALAALKHSRLWERYWDAPSRKAG